MRAEGGGLRILKIKRKTILKKFLTISTFVLFLLHQDLWFWKDSTLVFGFLPVGPLYHVLFCLAASFLMLGLVRYAWPGHLEAESSRNSAGKGESYS